MSVGESLERVKKGYERFFGFSEAPFSLAPNTRFLFESASYGEALTQVAYALERREPLVVVSGEIGTGKTLLCRTVVERLERKTFLSIINDPLLERDDLLKQMLQDFGVISRDRTKLAPTSRHDLVDALQEFLLSLMPLQAHAVLIIDEAQHVRPDVMEEIRLVSNIHDERGTMLQIILVGQQSLESLLSRPELRQLKQRVSRYVRLESLGATEVARYINHRLTVGYDELTRSHVSGAKELGELADWEGVRAGVAFTADAIDTVWRVAGGLPRVVNLLCDRALEAACAQRVRTVDSSLIHTATRALNLPDAFERTSDGEPPERAEEAPRVTFGALAPTPAPPRARRRFMPAALMTVAAAVIWFGARTILSPRNGEIPSGTAALPEENPPTARSTTASSEREAAAPAREGGSQAATVPGAAAAGPTVTDAKSSGEVFEIVVASFRTEGRAAAVASDITALGLPVRRRRAGGWQQVLAGPFTSRGVAEQAQTRLDRAGLTDTQIAVATR